MDTIPAVSAIILKNDPNQYFGTNTLKCSYNPFTFRTPGAITDFQNQIITPYPVEINSPYYVAENRISLDEANIFLCSRLSSTCDNGEDFCSMFHDTTNIGQYCIRQEIQDPSAMDEAKKVFCSNYDSEECGCIRKTNDPDYLLFKSHLDPSIQDECWYIPCSIGNDPLRFSYEPPPSDICVTEAICPDILAVYREYYPDVTENAIDTIECLNVSSINNINRSKGQRISRDKRSSFTTTNQALVSVYIVLGIAVGILILIIFLTFWPKKFGRT
jgi:hypothetical protein